MLFHKLKFVALTLLFLGAVAVGEGFVRQAPARQTAKPEPRPIAAKPDDDNPRPAPGRMFVVGRVLDPQGKPVPNATTMTYARSKANGHSPSMSRMNPIPIADARADGSGRFRIDAPRTSSSRYDQFGASAIAPGYGVGWVELDPDADQPTADITLRPEHVIQGRLFDLQGRPARDVEVSVRLMGRVNSQGRGNRVADFAELLFWWPGTSGLPAWPQPAITGAEGRFTIHGVGRGLRAFLIVHDPRFAAQQIEIDAETTVPAKPVTMALQPAKIITGRVTYADTGQPVPHALLQVQARNPARPGPGLTEFETDADGRFRINPVSGDGYGLTAFPPVGQPYLTAHHRLDWPKGAIEQSVDLALPRGALIHGTVTEEGSGQPIAGAIVRFITHAERQANATLRNRSSVLDTATDGSFQFGALPSPGYLSIMAPSDDYVLQTISEHMFDEGQPGGRQFYSNANIRLGLEPGVRDKEVHITLQRGITVKGQVIGPDGHPVNDAWMIGRNFLDASSSAWKRWSGDYHGMARGGHFEVHGLDPDAETPVYFLEPKRKLGTTVVLSSKSIALMTVANRTGGVAVGATVGFSGRSMTRGPITVHLEPCGSATARLVDPGRQASRGTSTPSVPHDGRHPRSARHAREHEGRPSRRRRGGPDPG